MKSSGTYLAVAQAYKNTRTYDVAHKIDISNAYNTVPWRLLEQELVRTKVHPSLKKYIMTFVKDRKHPDVKITCGIP